MLVVLAGSTYGIRILGVTTLGKLIEQRLGPLVSLLPVTLFSALVALMTWERAGELVLDARVAGVAAAAVAAWRRASMVVVILVAMAVTAGLRAFA